MNIAGLVFIFAGLFFLTISSIGILRLPDFYTRTHAAGKSETLGAMLFLFGLALYNGVEIISLKIIIILVFIGFANPTATHVIAKAALYSGLEPWFKKKDKTKEIKDDGS
jgi:multicomponent Na+:H+ antiporter subunit G